MTQWSRNSFVRVFVHLLRNGLKMKFFSPHFPEKLTFRRFSPAWQWWMVAVVTRLPRAASVFVSQARRLALGPHTFPWLSELKTEPEDNRGWGWWGVCLWGGFFNCRKQQLSTRWSCWNSLYSKSSLNESPFLILLHPLLHRFHVFINNLIDLHSKSPQCLFSKLLYYLQTELLSA